MLVTLKSRFGELTEFDDSHVTEAVRELIAELCDEQTGRPDMENSEIAVGHPSGWSVTATVHGTITFTMPGDSAEPQRYLFGLPTAELENLLMLVAKGDIETALRLPWVGSPLTDRNQRDYYLYLARHDLTDLHRAAAKGDCDWIESAVRHGESLFARDRDGATPLHRAAMAGQVDACRRLIALGADLVAADRDGVTPKDYAEMAEEFLAADELDELLQLLEDS